MSHEKSAKCPRCGRKSHTLAGDNEHVFLCHHCRLDFEDIDDGLTPYGNPAKIVERQEWIRKLRPVG